MRVRIAILLWFVSLFSLGQMQYEMVVLSDSVPILKDTLEPNSVVGYLYKGEVILLDIIYDEPSYKYNWVLVEKQVDSFSHDSVQWIYGYVERAYLIPLDSLDRYDGNNVGLRFTIEVYDSSELDINQFEHGTDNCVIEFPVVVKMELYWYGKWAAQDQKLYDDLCALFFEKGTYSTFKNRDFRVYKMQDFYYIEHSGGDGAGAYVIVWVIKKGKIIQRLVMDVG